MAETTRQRQVRFAHDIDALIQRRAEADGIGPSEWLRRLALRELDEEQARTVKELLQEIRKDHSEQLEQTRTELKGFVLEALMAMSERLAASQDAFLRELISALPQPPGTNSSLAELFSSPHRST
jgi:hypothetical protein